MNMERNVPEGVKNYVYALNFPTLIKIKVCEVYSQLDLTSDFRKKGRKKIICYCLHQAYLALGFGSIDVMFIAERVGLEKPAANAAIAAKPKYKTGYTSISATIPLPDMIRNFGDCVIGLDKTDIDVAIELFDLIIKKNPALLTEQARPLVAAFLLYYTKLNGRHVDGDDLADAFNLKYANISSLCNEISKIAPTLPQNINENTEINSVIII